MPDYQPGGDGAAATEQIRLEWMRFLQNVEMARHYDSPYELERASMPRNPIVDAILPTLLYVQLVSLLDEGLEAYRSAKDVPFPPKGKQDLFHRIELLKDHLRTPSQLHELRKKRKPLAHDPATFINWDELEQAIQLVDRELHGLGLTGERPRYEFFAERSGAESSDDPRVAFQYEYKFGLKHQGEVVRSLSWKKQVLHATAS